MDKNLIESDYQGFAVTFTGKAWFNATAVAARFGKEVHDWLRQDGTKEYIAALQAESKSGPSPELESFILTKRGRHASGTWLHPELAVAFARWLDVRFGIWCDRQIRAILTGSHPTFDWRRERIQASNRFSVMSDVLKESREDQGKETKPYHYSNEALMVNECLTGIRGPVDRDSLSSLDLRLLGRLEAKNTVLIGRDYPYQYRKAILSRFAAEERAKLITKLEARA